MHGRLDYRCGVRVYDARVRGNESVDDAIRTAPVAPARRGCGLSVQRLAHWPHVTWPRPFAAVRQIDLASTESIQLLDITDDVAAFSRQFGSWHGTVSIFSRHTTAAIRIQEDEPLLLEDLRDFLTRLAPPDGAYAHNDFRVRTEHMHPDERPNGHAHCLHLLLGASASVPVVDGVLQLGTWQRIFVVELDGPRTDRQVQLHLTGLQAGGSR
jgi:secondary thiamine-phosphate synthase enzyme